MISATDLVHDAYLKFVASRRSFEGRRHLVAAAAITMRRLVVDHGRVRARLKRGGDRERVVLNETMRATPAVDIEVLALGLALKRLAARDQRKAKVIELHFFDGLGIQETADALEISRRTVLRDLDLGKAWLAEELSDAR